MEIIRWEAPAPTKTNSSLVIGKYVAVANALRANPGEWAIIRENAPANLPWQIRHGKVKGFAPAGSFEAVGRTTETGSKFVTVYARYVGQ